MTIWLLCANIGGARLFEWTRQEDRLKFLRQFPYSHDADGRIGHRGHPTDSDHQAAVNDNVVSDYARQLVADIDRELMERRFDRLIVAADADFLAPLEKAIETKPELLKALVGVVDQDLYDDNESDIWPYIEDMVLRVSRPDVAA